MIRQLGINWPSLLPVIEDATRLISSGESCQPVKPYLRFPDPANRIIAMPAWLGGNCQCCRHQMDRQLSRQPCPGYPPGAFGDGIE